MASSECPTCCNEYDSGEHRVRVLHCGHSQCTNCMWAQFSNGRITCASCRTTNIYIDFNNIPVCYIAEKMKEEMDKLKIHETLLEGKDAVPLAPKLHKGICAEHAAFKLFWCNSHHEWICPHCTVTDHPREDCDVIPIRKKLENDKELMKLNISKELKHLDNIENEVELSINEVGKQAEEEKNKITKLKEGFVKLKKLISQKEKEVGILNIKQSKLDALTQECMKKKLALKNLMTRLHDVSTFKELDLENDTRASIINRYENWGQELEEELSNEINLPDMLVKLKNVTDTQEKESIIQEAKKMLQQIVKRRKMYASKIIGKSKFYSLIEQRQGCIILSDLQHHLSPSANSTVFEFDDVMAMVSSQPVAFLTMTHHGTTLGHIHIRLDGPPRNAQQFMELSTGSSGRGCYRAMRFDEVMFKGQPGEHVICLGYTNGASDPEYESLYQVGTSSFVSTTEGDVYVETDSSFGICTRTKSNNTSPDPDIGHVISGLSDLRAAIEKYDVKDIVFSDCGVIIDGSINQPEERMLKDLLSL